MLNQVKLKGSLAGQIRELKSDPDFVAEGMALSFVEEVLCLMEKQGMSQAELAHIMGVSPAVVSRIFSAPPNLTLKSMAKIALALGVTPQVKFEDSTYQAYGKASASKRRVAEK